MDSLRQARRPTLVYGTRVREGLRGRWFSLVPVDRSALAKFIAVLATVVLAIILINDATVRLASIESRPAFVDVFQINRLGSLGRYLIGVMYLAMGGAAWMIYQLRRFRNDDFRGNYRLWQWIVGVSLVSSVATVVPLIAMLGAAVEALMGRRIALSGHDWIGLFLVVGGAVLALRTIAEMWRYRVSLILLIGGWACVAIPVAAQWNMIAVDTILRWSIVTSAPLLAVTLWFTASVVYLRSLYCEVRGIEPAAGIFQRLRAAAPLGFSRRDSIEPADSSTVAKSAPARKPATKPSAKTSSVSRVTAKATTKTDGDAAADDRNESDSAPAKRRWFGLLPPAKSPSGTSRPKPTKSKPTKTKSTKTAPPKSDDAPAQEEMEDATENETKDDQEPKTRRRWWPSLRGGSKPKPKSKSTSKPETSDEDAEDAPQIAESDSSEQQSKKRRFGLGSMMKRKSGSESDSTATDEEDNSSSNRRDTSSPPPKSSRNRDAEGDDENDSDDEGFSDDDIDWSSMNKAERRRMRKQLKRGGRAA